MKVALAESLGIQHRYHISVETQLPLTIVAIDFSLHAVLDLTDEKRLTTLDLSVPTSSLSLA